MQVVATAEALSEGEAVLLPPAKESDNGSHFQTFLLRILQEIDGTTLLLNGKGKGVEACSHVENRMLSIVKMLQVRACHELPQIVNLSHRCVLGLRMGGPDGVVVAVEG